MKLVALVHLERQRMDGPAEIIGHNAEGEPIYRYPREEFETGSIFEIDDETGERLLRRGYATADLSHVVPRHE